jgi:lysophospholipase L1-like esterase
MKAHTFLFLICIFAFSCLLFDMTNWSLTMAQVTPADRTAFKVHLASGKVPAGFTHVPPTQICSELTEFGYDFVTPGTKPGSDDPFLFSFKVPEGNYRVTLTLGDPNGVSNTTVKAESRRLMVERIDTANGKLATCSFVVNVRRPILPSGGNVRLKPREIGHLNWDDKLTLEFTGARPRVSTIEITRDDSVPTVFLAGDSTVTDQRNEPWSAWGQMLPRFFRDDIAIANNAESGESLKSFVGEKRLEKVMSQIKAGDWLFIQFNHNDQKEKGEGVGPFTTYKASLKRFIAEARSKGAHPVLVTAMFRRNFDEHGKIVDTMAQYPEAVRQTAAEEKVTLIDLNAMSRTLFEAMGPETSKKAFVHYPAGSFPGQTEELKDDTHFNTYGAYELAKCVVEGIKKDSPELARCLRDDTPLFDPAKPDPVEKWNLPSSPAANPQKSEGN